MSELEEFVALPVRRRQLPRLALALDRYRTEPRRGGDADADDLAVLSATARALFLDGVRHDATPHDSTGQAGVDGPSVAGADGVTLLTYEGVRLRLGVSLRTVQRLVSRDGLPTVKVGARRRVRSVDLDEWLDRERQR